jgi:betaine-aldehyde dehydrogenase
VIADVDHSMKVMTEETFGPVIPVMKVADADEAVHLANGTRYGLSASVFAGSTSHGEQIARRIEAGAVNVNDVLTTGATVEACVRTLQRGGARHVDVLTLARVVRPAL